ncbi:MAG: hypothetical protein HY904_02955 [Deltaproteobacteria bacterium]|nr:hypothetical protein [Deltaproteobacteria bacterium]
MLAVPANWPDDIARVAYADLVHRLETGLLRPGDDVHAWTLDDEPGELGRYTPVRLLSPAQCAASLQRASSAPGPAANDLEHDLGAHRIGYCQPEPFVPRDDDEREALAGVRGDCILAENAQRDALAVKHREEREVLRSSLRGEGANRAQGADNAEAADADARIARLGARQRDERDRLHAEGRERLRAALDACQSALRVARIARPADGATAGLPVNLNRAQVVSRDSDDVTDFARWENEGGARPPPPPDPLTRLNLYGWRNPTRCESGTWMRWKCDNGHERSAYCGCKTLDCEVCRDEVTRQRANRAWETTGRLASSYGWHVLTVPPSCRQAVADAGPRAFARTAWRAVARWYAEKGYDVGGMVFLHPVGSMPRACACGAPPPTDGVGALRARCRCGRDLDFDDGDRFHPHANVGVPLVGQDGNGAAVVVPRWKTEADLKRLRDLYRQELSALVGEDTGRVVVNYRYTKTTVQARHALRYFARSFPGWSAWTSLRGGSFYGLLSNGVAMRFHLNVIRAGLRRAIEPPLRACAVCGAESHIVSITAGAPPTGPP